jgi:hypothetical protein
MERNSTTVLGILVMEFAHNFVGKSRPFPEVGCCFKPGSMSDSAILRSRKSRPNSTTPDEFGCGALMDRNKNIELFDDLA